MTEIVRVFRRAILRLARSPGFTLTSVLTLGLGIGATIAVYTVVQNVLLEPLPYPHADRLVLIQEKNPEAGFPRFSISPLNFRDYRAMSTSFEAMAASTGTTLAIGASDGNPARRLAGRAVTADYLRVLGVRPLRGRDFTAEDDKPGAPKVVLLSYDVWQSLGGEPELVGRSLVLDGEPTEVIGVLPQGFRAVGDALVPLAVDYESSGRGGHYLMGMGRLEDGVSVEQARSELETVAASLEETYPQSNAGWGAIVDPLQERLVENIHRALWVLLAAVGLVLLIACANVANLTLARSAALHHEVALKSALGAGRGRLLREQLLESLLIALVACGMGLLLGHYGTTWMVALNADQVPRSATIGIDSAVVVAALALALFTVLIFGLLPAWRSLRGDLAGALQEVGRGQAGSARSSRMRSLLVSGEVALALVLLVGAGLLLRTLDRLLDVDPGFDTGAIWTASASLPDSAYPDTPEQAAFLDQLVESARAVPGVSEAATVMPMPLSGGDYVLAFYLEGEPIPEPNKEHTANIRFISPGYFRAMGIPLLSGRDLDRRDDLQAGRVALVNRSASERFWPGGDPVGQRLAFDRPDDPETEWYTVVGTVADVHHESLDTAMEPAIYRAALQGAPSFFTVVLRATGDPANLAAPLRDLVGRLDPNLPLFREQRGVDLVASSLTQPRSNATLLASFASLALVLAAIGVFSVVSYLVALQLRELGLRVALGAGRGRILALVLWQGLRPVLAGLVVGLIAAGVASRLLESLVFEVPVSDPVTYAVVACVLAAVAAMASLIPALRATRLDPMKVLREE